MPAPTQRRHNAAGHVGALLALILVPMAGRVWLATALGLAPDEAYYWTWSRHLAWGYLDHPPAVAGLIRVGTVLAGEGVLGVRLPALVMGGALLPVVVYWLAREAGASRHAALLLPAAVALQPLGIAGGLLITPDVPLLLFWSAAAAALLCALRTASTSAWVAAGLAMGGALLSKHSAWLLVASAAAGLAASVEGRRALKARGPMVLGIALVVALPNLVWDGAHGFQSLGFQLRHGVASGGLGNPLWLLGLVAAQVGLLTPVVAWGAIRYLARWREAETARDRLLWVMAAAPLLVFALASLLARPEANWPAPAHPLLIAGAVAALSRQLAVAQGAARRRLTVVTALAVATSAAVAAACVLHAVRPLAALPAGGEPLARVRAWQDLPRWLPQERAVWADGYELGAALTFHLPGRPAIADGRRREEEAPPAGVIVIAAGPGASAPRLPRWARRWELCSVELGSHAMQRRDGQVVRTLQGWRVGACGPGHGAAAVDESAAEEPAAGEPAAGEPPGGPP